MSIIGTGIAAGVANTGQVAKQANAASSGKDAQRADSSKQTDKLKLTQLHGASATRDADQDLPDGQAPGYDQLYQGEAEHEVETPNDLIHDHDAPASSTTDVPLAPTYGPSAKDHPLFHELDIKA